MAKNSENTNKSVLEEAISEYRKIFDSANESVKKDLTESLSKKFDKFLMEEINKINNKEESVKEPVNEGKIQELKKVNKVADKKKESVNESDNHKNGSKKKINENNEMDLDMRELSLADIEEAFDSAEGDDEIIVTSDNKPVATIDPEPDVNDLDLSDIESELADMEEAANGMEEKNAEVNDPYTKFKKMYEEMGKVIKEMEDSKMHETFANEFDVKMTEMYGEDYKDGMDEAMHNQMFEMYKNSKMKSELAEPMNEGEDYDDEKHGKKPGEPKGHSDKTGEAGRGRPEKKEKVDEMHQGKFNAAKHNANINPKTINEKEENPSEIINHIDTIKDLLGGDDNFNEDTKAEVLGILDSLMEKLQSTNEMVEEQVVDETSTTLAHNKKVTGPETPQPEYRDFKEKRIRY
ncbi:MAG: hypothetical protein ACOCV1_06170, partial [Bacillota bacterium]